MTKVFINCNISMGVEIKKELGKLFSIQQMGLGYWHYFVQFNLETVWQQNLCRVEYIRLD